jgi:hypothetical protein
LWKLPLRWLTIASKTAEVTSLSVIASLLAAGSEFALHCHVQRRQMTALSSFNQRRQHACMQLGWRWEADDQEMQYKPGSSAGTHATVGPISGFVMDVTENEYGHAVGQCHAVNASYKDLLSQY